MVASPVIGAPLTAVMIVFELTRNYDVTITALVRVAFSNVAAYRLFGRSPFDVQLGERGVGLSSGRGKLALQACTVGDLMGRDAVRADRSEPVGAEQHA